MLCIPMTIVFAFFQSTAPAIKLISPAFDGGKPIPTKYANTGIRGGHNSSPPIKWSNPPAETKSFVVTMIDLHPIAGNWLHWCIINIPRHVTILPESLSTITLPPGAKELYNSFGTLGYGGPQPPKGSGPHTYEITVYALSEDSLGVSANATLKGIRKALEGKVLAQGRLLGTYEQ